MNGRFQRLVSEVGTSKTFAHPASAMREPRNGGGRQQTWQCKYILLQMKQRIEEVLFG
jgi:hypothetical protein